MQRDAPHDCNRAIARGAPLYFILGVREKIRISCLSSPATLIATRGHYPAQLHDHNVTAATDGHSRCELSHREASPFGSAPAIDCLQQSGHKGRSPYIGHNGHSGVLLQTRNFRVCRAAIKPCPRLSHELRVFACRRGFHRSRLKGEGGVTVPFLQHHDIVITRRRNQSLS